MRRVLVGCLAYVLYCFSSVSAGEPFVSPAHHSKTVNGVDIHYTIAGEGPPVFLLHGWPFTSYSWRHTIPALAEHYTVIAPDLRGYGYSGKPATGYDKRTMAADIKALAEALGFEKIALIGHDRGARVATRFAKDHPGFIDRLVTIDNIPTVYVFEHLDARLAGAYWIFLFNSVPDVPERLITGHEDYWIRYFINAWSYNPGFLSEDDIAVYVNAIKAPGGLRGGLSDYRAAPIDVEQDLADRDQKISVPVMTLWGAEFELVGGMFDVEAVWREFATDLTAIPVPLAGHMPHEENPDFVNARLLEFLEGWGGVESKAINNHKE